MVRLWWKWERKNDGDGRVVAVAEWKGCEEVKEKR